MQKNNKQDQRSRSAKTTTIHACAQSGDFAAFQKLLKENPSLLNDRNPVLEALCGEWVDRKNQIKEAEGGILFVDEAYRLIPMQKSDDKDYGLEAFVEIMSVMDSGKIVVIFTGYSEPMKRVITSNEGFCRRVTKFFYFEDFIPKDLARILHIKMNNQAEGSLLYGFKLHPSCSEEAIVSLIESETTEKTAQGDEWWFSGSNVG